MSRRTQRSLDAPQIVGGSSTKAVRPPAAPSKVQASGTEAGPEKLSWVAWFGTAAGASLIGAVLGLGGAFLSPIADLVINSDEREQDLAVALDAKQSEVAQAVTTAANEYVGVLSGRLYACRGENKDSDTCRSSSLAGYDAQQQLRTSVATAHSVLGPEGIAQLGVVDSYFPNLYKDNEPGLPPHEVVDIGGLHAALARLNKVAREPIPEP